MAFSLKFRDVLPPIVRDELDSLISQLQGYLSQQHTDEGAHGTTTAEHLGLQGANVGEITTLAFDAARYSTSGGGTWTVGSGDQLYLRYSRMGQMVFIQFYLESTGITVDTPDYLVINLPELHALPTLNSSGNPATQMGGVCEWVDSQNSRAGIGVVSAVAHTFSGAIPATALFLARFSETDDGAATDTYFPQQRQWPISNNFFISGSCTFMVTPNNDATPFFGS